MCADHRSQKLLAAPTVASSSQGLRNVQSASGTHAGPDAWMNGMERTLRSEQKQIADAGFDLYMDPDRDRCSVRAACGMGKTTMEQAVMAKISDSLQNTEGRSGHFLIVVPTVNLANQMRDDILNDGVLVGAEYDADASNSDLLVVHNESEQFKGTQDKDQSHRDIVRRFMEQDSDAPKVVIAVVDSVDKVAGGQGERDFDMAFFDEAHNYAADIGANGSPVKPIYFNEQRGGLQAKNRMFLSATPKTASKNHMLSVPYGHAQKGKNREHIINLSHKEGRLKKSDELVVNQDGTSHDVFGEHVGSWGYRHAIDSGYLSPVDVYSHSVRAVQTSQSPDEASNYTRDTKVDAHGRATSDPQAISLGAYVSMRSTVDALLDGQSRNVLSFSDSVAECQDIGRTWEEYLDDLARASNGGKGFRNDDEARMAISLGGEKGKAGKYHLLARHAKHIASWSNAPKSVRDQAEQFFDKREIGDAAPCTCGGRAMGQWCACARIVNNVDMLSEGISINSIDTVILNRPSYSSDKDVTQALGRASRKMRGPRGEDNIKGTGRVIIPRIEATVEGYEDQWSRPVEDQAYLKALGAINRVWNDVDGHYLDNHTTPLYDGDMQTMKVYALDPASDMVQGDIDSEIRNVTTQGGNLPLDQYNAILNTAWRTARDRASAEWNKSHPKEQSFATLRNTEKESLCKAQMSEVAASIGKSGGPKRGRIAADVLVNSSWDDFQCSERYMEVNDIRGSAGEFGFAAGRNDSAAWRSRAKAGKNVDPSKYIEMNYWDDMAAAFTQSVSA